MRCPGFHPDQIKPLDEDDYDRIIATAPASEYHLCVAHPHAFCGCGTDADNCHPGRCCKDDQDGQCVNCHLADPGPDPLPEIELSDGLFA